MTKAPPDAYCFFQQIAPRRPFVARFDADYLLHAVEGALNVEITGRRWLLPRSFAAWVPAETEIRVVIDRPVTSCSILSKPGFAIGFPNRPVAFQMSRLTREMAHHCRAWGKDDPHPPQAATFFSALLSTCAGLIEGSLDVSRPFSDDPQLAKAIAFLERHLDQPLATEDLARASGLSRRTLQRRFADDLGTSWRKTLRRIRMIHAIDGLTRDNVPVLQIAVDCGYSSLSAFNESFQAFAGMTPTQFRRQLA